MRAFPFGDGCNMSDRGKGVAIQLAPLSDSGGSSPVFGVGGYIFVRSFAAGSYSAACGLLVLALHCSTVDRAAGASVGRRNDQCRSSGRGVRWPAPSITAGGFVKTGPVVFNDTAKQAGLSKWRNVTGTTEKRVIIEARARASVFLITTTMAGSISTW